MARHPVPSIPSPPSVEGMRAVWSELSDKQREIAREAVGLPCRLGKGEKAAANALVKAGLATMEVLENGCAGWGPTAFTWVHLTVSGHLMLWAVAKGRFPKKVTYTKPGHVSEGGSWLPLQEEV